MSVSWDRSLLVSRWFDGLVLIGAPLIALLIGIAVSATHIGELRFQSSETEVVALLLGILIHAHLVVVFVRSHGNPRIRQLHPLRFFLVPPLLLAAMLLSQWVLVCVSVLATFWDVYHSGLQTFGIGRIYERRAGNAPLVGRQLDQALNHLLYAGPIVAGATMLDHFEDFTEFDDVGATFFRVVPAFMDSNQRYVAWVLLVFGSLFLVYYTLSYYRLSRAGHVISIPKLALYVITGACSIYTWGFNTWGEAFLIMNLFHAVQYFGIVWWQERSTLSSWASKLRLPTTRASALIVLLAIGIAYGCIVELEPFGAWIIYPVSLVVSIMHFWYDGFIWSVRKRQV